MHLMRTLTLMATASILAPALIGCGSATPTPEPTAMPVVEIGKPVLTALKPMVTFREKETEEGRELAADETAEVEPGANILTSDGGRAAVTWDGFLTHELLTDTDTLVSLSQPETRYAILDQATGTARYTLQGPGEPATLTVKARWIKIDVKEGAADFIVSLVPGTEPSAWLAVLEGSAEVQAEGSEDVVTVAAGQAAGFSEAGEVLPEARDVDPAVIKGWYEDAANGEAETSIVGVTFRCEVSADEAPFLSAAEADAEAAGDPLAKGTIVGVVQRDDDGAWLRVQPVAKTTLGWVAAGDLSCSGPVNSVSTTAPGEIGEPTPTLALATRPPILLATRTPTAIGTGTVTPTPTPGAVVIEFSAGDDEVEEGGCTTLNWTVRGVKAYYVNGEGKAGEKGGTRVCPDDDTTYTLRAVKPDGTEESRSVKVKVRPKEATNTVPVPPTAVPPTVAPPTVAPPTNTPEPQATDQPTTEPATEQPTAPALLTDTPEPPTASP